jgi:hypothetical protein
MKNKNNYFLTLGLTILFGVIGQSMLAASAGAASFDQNQALAGFAQSNAGTEKKHIAMVETQGVDTVLDIPLRLGGFVATLVGTGFFIGTSPITGLMTALYPHNAIEKAADFLVVRPGNYTFVRPSGRFNYDSRSDEEK